MTNYFARDCESELQPRGIRGLTMKYLNFPNESARPRVTRGIRGAFVAAFVTLLFSVGCGDYSGSETDTSIVANSVGTSLPQGLSVTEQVTSFEATVYPVVRQYCIGCHAAGGSGSPKIARLVRGLRSSTTRRSTSRTRPPRDWFEGWPRTSIIAGRIVPPMRPSC